MTKRLNWLSIVDIVVPPHNRCRDMLAAPSPTSVVASCHAAACVAALTTLKSFNVIKDLKVPNDFFRKSLKMGKGGRGLHYTQIQVVENLPNDIIQNPRPPKQYDWSSRFSYGNRPCVPDGTQAGCKITSMSHPCICRLVTNFHVRIYGKCIPLFSGLQCKDSTKRRDCKFFVGEFFEAADKCPPRDLNDPNDFKVVKVLSVKQPPDIGGCGKVLAGAVSRR